VSKSLILLGILVFLFTAVYWSFYLLDFDFDFLKLVPVHCHLIILTFYLCGKKLMKEIVAWIDRDRKKKRELLFSVVMIAFDKRRMVYS
jgi:Kef-type K+ transport system membrane component KefB